MLFEIPRDITIGLESLKKQKKALQDTIPEGEKNHILWGLVAVIEAIQDRLVDVHGFDEEKVFDIKHKVQI